MKNANNNIYTFLVLLTPNRRIRIIKETDDGINHIADYERKKIMICNLEEGQFFTKDGKLCEMVKAYKNGTTDYLDDMRETASALSSTIVEAMIKTEYTLPREVKII